MIHELKFSYDTMFSDRNGKKINVLWKWLFKMTKMSQKALEMAEKFVPQSRLPEC
jgi:hypothetical protein